MEQDSTTMSHRTDDNTKDESHLQQPNESTLSRYKNLKLAVMVGSLGLSKVSGTLHPKISYENDKINIVSDLKMESAVSSLHKSSPSGSINSEKGNSSSSKSIEEPWVDTPTVDTKFKGPLPPLTIFQDLIYSQKERTEQSHESRLMILPNEMFLQITRHLPASSVASLALTCKIFMTNFGTESFKTISTNIPQKSELLTFLSRDIPSIYCPPCCKLHSIYYTHQYTSHQDYSNTPRYLARNLACKVSDWRNLLRTYFGRNFTTTAYRLALKFAQDHPLDTRMLDLLSSHHKSTVDSKYRLQIKSEYRILEGNMYHRLQSICYPRTNSMVPFPHPCIFICRHLNFGVYDGKVFISFNGFVMKEQPFRWDLVNNLAKIWESKWPVESGRDGVVGTDVRMCRHCGTYFDLEFIAEKGNVSMAFRRWSALGSGVESREWKKHFEPRGDLMLPTVLGTERAGLDGMFRGEVLAVPELKRSERRDIMPVGEGRYTRCFVAG